MFRATDTIQIRSDQVPPAERLCSPILADFGRDRAETSLLQGLVDAQIDQVELSTSSPRPTAGVVSSPRTRIFGQPNDVCLRKSLETNKSPTAFRNHDRVFPIAQGPELEEPQNGLRPFGKIPNPPRGAGGRSTTPRGQCAILAPTAIADSRAYQGIVFRNSRIFSSPPV